MIAGTLDLLLIEDDIPSTELIVRALRRSSGSYRITVATTLAEGITAAKNVSFPIVITDLTLPDSSGLDTVDRLKNAAPEASIIVQSGSNDERLYTESLSRGADSFLCKDDLDPIVIHRMLSQCMLRRSQRQQINRLLDAVGLQKDKLELSERKLQDKNARLEKLCKASQKFVNNISHEFRTPLCVVRQYASLIADGIVGDVNEEQRRMLQVVEARIDDLSTMVDDMLDVSRHESGLLAASRDVTNAQAIVDEVLPSHQQRAALRKIAIVARIDPDLPDLYCDGEKVGRTLINLLTNATKFSANGGEIQLTAQTTNSGKDVRFSVIDSGQGIAPEDCEAIFQRFRQSGSQFGQSTQGFGLGLSIAKELVDLNLGEMSVESEVNVGSTFSFTVPVNDNVEIVQRFVRRANATFPAIQPAVCAIQLSVQEGLDDNVSADEVHAFLNYVVRSRDLLIRIEQKRWSVLLGNPDDDQAKFLSRLRDERLAINRNRPVGKLPGICAHQPQYICTGFGEAWIESVLAAQPALIGKIDDNQLPEIGPTSQPRMECSHFDQCSEALAGNCEVKVLNIDVSAIA